MVNVTAYAQIDSVLTPERGYMKATGRKGKRRAAPFFGVDLRAQGSPRRPIGSDADNAHEVTYGELTKNFNPRD